MEALTFSSWPHFQQAEPGAVMITRLREAGVGGLIVKCPQCGGLVGLPFAGQCAGRGRGWWLRARDPMTIEPGLRHQACGWRGALTAGLFTPSDRGPFHDGIEYRAR